MATTTKGLFGRGIGISDYGTFGLFARGLVAGPAAVVTGAGASHRKLNRIPRSARIIIFFALLLA